MSLEQDLLNLKGKADRLNNLKVETSTKLDLLEKEKNSLLAECATLNVDPANIEITVKDEEAKLQLEISTLENQIDGVLGEIGKI